MRLAGLLLLGVWDLGETLRKVAENSTFTALSRIAVFVVTALAIPSLTWIISATLEAKEQNALQKLALEVQGRQIGEHTASIAEIKRTRDTDRDALLAMKTDLGRALEKLDGQSGSLRRIEAWIDQQRVSRP